MASILRRKLPLTAGVIALALAIAACGGSGSAANKSAATGSGVSKTFSVGLLGILSGPTALPQFTNGAIAYMKAANAAGGVSGYHFSWTLDDDGNNAATAVTQARSLVQSSHVDALIGTATGPTTAVKSVASSLGIPVLMGADGGLFSPPVANMFSLQPDYNSMWQYAANIAKNKLGSTKLGLIYSNDAFGIPAANGLAAYAPSHGVTIPASIAVPVGTTDYASIVSKMRNSGATVVALATEGGLMSGIISAATQIGYSPQWIANWGVESPAVVGALTAAQRASITAFDYMPPLTSNPTSDGTAGFVAGMKKYDPADLDDSFAQSGWDFGALISYAIEHVVKANEPMSSSTLINALLTLKDSAVGTIPSAIYDNSEHYGVNSLISLKYVNGAWTAEGGFSG